ncbi:dihydroorotase [Canibacter sp. lx-45]|uniref:dihydroorotase n=1 Tax=Canibacter zhuwentaonis TaxID=2837491 RepID=UPI001BDBBF00|nr:dihydroorotase [Canibacter zhuwentaonis]MBT1034948.1 dihydroorotase [Canibacter zhuwentaonis]
MSYQKQILIRGVQLAKELTTPGRLQPAVDTVDILIIGDKISSVAPCITEVSKSAEIIEGHGLIAATGFVDLHTHLREPGFVQSETIYTGSRAAAAGGFTTVFAMANTDPVADTAAVVEQVAALGEQAGYVTVRPIGAVTQQLAGEKLSAIGQMANSRAAVRVFSDDGKCVHNSQLMRRALEYVKTFDGVIAQHAQDPELTTDAQMHESTLASELGLGGWPAVAEASIIARDAMLAEHTGARLHVCHLSTAAAVRVLRAAKARGVRITAEVTPHHLLLTEEAVRGYDARYKVNPPLRQESDVETLRRAVAEGVIDIIATDHAPHSPEAKECEFQSAAFGMVGLESALSVAVTSLIVQGHISWAKLEQLLSQKPAEIGGYAAHPKSIAPGEIADIVLIDPATKTVFEPNMLCGKNKNSPFLGLELVASVYTTIRHGVITRTSTGVVQL